MFVRNVFRLLCVFVIYCCLNVSYADDRYFLCGPDEDGCFLDQTQHCACIPFDVVNGNQPYCLDFNNLQCHPLSQVPNCPSGFIFKNQGACIATIFQSEPEPGCSMTSSAFCYENNIHICDTKGNPRDCKKPHD